jgi:hypothetical protein
LSTDIGPDRNGGILVRLSIHRPVDDLSRRLTPGLATSREVTAKRSSQNGGSDFVQIHLWTLAAAPASWSLRRESDARVNLPASKTTGQSDCGAERPSKPLIDKELHPER